jgi:quercetin dioxygenase-like cupin family protein
MDRRLAAAIVVSLAWLGGTAPAQEGALPPAPARTTILSRNTTTITGQPLVLPPAPVEAVFSRVVMPAGGVLPMHKHPWPRYAFIESGRILVRYQAAGLEREFGPGETAIEAVDQWHEGRALGSEPVVLLVIDHVPPGEVNIVRR